MYVDKQGMIERYGETLLIQLTGHDDPTGAIVDAVLDKALADAAATIHGYARTGGYVVPFVQIPDMVEGWQACIAFYSLHREGAEDKVVEDFKTAMAQLRDLARGLLTLQAEGATAPETDGGETVLFDAPEREFDKSKLGGF